jgi:hypothetical protein
MEMAKELPYLSTYKNVGELFARIESAKQPDAFTTRYLIETIGLKSTGDRQLISLLKTLGFLDSGGRPTQTYGHLKNKAKAPEAIAAGIRKGYEPLYDANQKAHTLSASDLKGLISQVAGTDTGTTAKIAGTFGALIKVADFSKSSDPADEEEDELEEEAADEVNPTGKKLKLKNPGSLGPALRPEFHYNIQVHLPANASEENYLQIFNALRKSFVS